MIFRCGFSAVFVLNLLSEYALAAEAGPACIGWIGELQQHPIRLAIAIISLSLALLLTIYKMLERVILRVAKSRKYGRTIEGGYVERRSFRPFRPSRHGAPASPEVKVQRYRRPGLFSKRRTRSRTYRPTKSHRRRRISRRRYGRH